MQLSGSLSILCHCLSLELEWKLTFSSPVPLLSFPNLLAYWVQHFHSIIFQDLKSSTGIPSPPLALFIVMLSEAYLTSHSRMSGSSWVIIPPWLSGYLKTRIMRGHMFLWWPGKNCYSLAGKFWFIHRIHQTLHLQISIYFGLYKILLMEKKFNSLENCKRYLKQFFAQNNKKLWEDEMMKLPGKWQKIV